MWITEKLQERKGWSHLWQDGDQYWFFWHTPEKVWVHDLRDRAYAIVWLTTPNITRSTDGIYPTLNALHTRGAVAYETKEALDQAWEYLLRDPTGFMIRVSL